MSSCLKLSIGGSSSSKFDDFGTNWKRIGLCDFLCLCEHDIVLGRILHRFWDTATYWLKIANFSCSSLILLRRPPALPMVPLEVSGEVNRGETTARNEAVKTADCNCVLMSRICEGIALYKYDLIDWWLSEWDGETINIEESCVVPLLSQLILDETAVKSRVCQQRPVDNEQRAAVCHVHACSRL